MRRVALCVAPLGLIGCWQCLCAARTFFPRALGRVLWETDEERAHQASTLSLLTDGILCFRFVFPSKPRAPSHSGA
jgi:hypothetical protein